MNIEKIINDYFYSFCDQHKTLGSLICGSYIRNEYSADSDLDILVIIEGCNFKMKLEYFSGVLFDRIIVEPQILRQILTSISGISNVLSYSFGSSNKIISPSSFIDEKIIISKSNIANRGLRYSKPENKPNKIGGHIPFTIKRESEDFFLIKDGKVIV